MFTAAHVFKDAECQGNLVEFERDENWVLCTCDRCGADFSFDRGGEKELRRRVDVDARTQSQREDGAPF
jgi:hypothetical protein